MDLSHILDSRFHNNIDDWDSHYGHLREDKNISIFLVLMLVPYGIQVGGLLAENLMMMVLTMKGLQLHIENFLEEFKR